MPDVRKAVNLDDMAHLYAPFVKVEKSEALAADGLPEYVIVKGVCTGPDVDIDGQRMDPQWLRRELPEWYADWGNIRAMHKADAVGVATELTERDDGDWYMVAKIVDRDAVRKVIEGVYKGFSIGIKNPVLAPDTLAPKGRYVGGKVIETSVVDRPAYNSARFDGFEQPVLAAKFVLGQAVGASEWRDAQTGIVLTKAAGDPAASVMPSTGALRPQQTKSEGGSPVELSFEQIRDKVNQACRPKTDDAPYCYVMDTYGTYVILCEGEKYYKVLYTINADGTVALGDRTEVVRTYSEVAKAAALELAKKAAEGAEEDDTDSSKSGEAKTCPDCGKELTEGEEHTCEKAAEGETEEEKAAKAAARKAADMAAARAASPAAKLDYSRIGHEIVTLIKPTMDAFAAQVDSGLQQINAAVREAKASIPATGHSGTFDPNNPAVKASLTEIVKAILAGELVPVAPELAGKAAGADSAKAVTLADAVKGLVEQVVGGIEQRLQAVEQAAAPAKGGLVEVERLFAGITQAGASPEVMKAAQDLVRAQNDNSETGQLVRAAAMLKLTQTLAKPVQN